MKIIFLKICCLLFFLFIYNASPAQSNAHQDELIYYTTLARQMKEALPQLQSLWAQLQQTLIAASQTKNQQPDRAAIENIKSLSTESRNDLNRKIRTVNVLHETDVNLNLKQSVINLFTDAKNIQETAIPVILSVLSNGVDKINNQQTSTLKSFLSKGQELQNKSREIENLFDIYRRTHNITDEELHKFGF